MPGVPDVPRVTGVEVAPTGPGDAAWVNRPRWAGRKAVETVEPGEAGEAPAVPTATGG